MNNKQTTNTDKTQKDKDPVVTRSYLDKTLDKRFDKFEKKMDKKMDQKFTESEKKFDIKLAITEARLELKIQDEAYEIKQLIKENTNMMMNFILF